MSIFCFKKLPTSSSLSKQLRQARDKLGLTLESLSQQTRLPSKYLEAMESGLFSELPKARAYRLAYIKQYARVLGLNPDLALYQFAKEEGLEDIPTEHLRNNIKPFPFGSLGVLLRNVGIATFIILFAIYLSWQVRGILTPPRLAISTPFEGATVNRLETTVRGEAEKESQLMINGQEVRAADDGRFSASVTLSPGLNTISVTAIKKHGKTTTETRHVIVRLPADDGIVTVSSTAFKI